MPGPEPGFHWRLGRAGRQGDEQVSPRGVERAGHLAPGPRGGGGVSGTLLGPPRSAPDQRCCQGFLARTVSGEGPLAGPGG